MRLKAVTLEQALAACRSKMQSQSHWLSADSKHEAVHPGALHLKASAHYLWGFGVSDFCCCCFFFLSFELMYSWNMYYNCTIFVVMVSVFDMILLLSSFNCQVSSSWMCHFYFLRKHTGLNKFKSRLSRLIDLFQF